MSNKKAACLEPFDLERWKREWTANARDGHENSCRDVGWSQAVDERTEAAERRLLMELARYLAVAPDARPEQVALVQSAARLLHYGRLPPREASRE